MKVLDDLRNAHSTGYTFAGVFQSDKSLYITAGEDGEVKLFPDVFEDETITRSIPLKIVNCTLKNDLLFFATDKHEVKSYLLPEITFQNVLLRFTSTVNHIGISFNGKYLCACSSDFSIKVVSTNGGEQRTLTGHDAPVLSCCFVAGEKALISFSCDGTLKLWDIQSQKCLKSVLIFEKCNSSANYIAVLSSSINKIVGVPIKKQIKIFSVGELEEQSTLETEHTENISLLQFSDSGKYLCSSTKNGEVFVWEMSNLSCVKRYQHPSNKRITSIRWKNEKEIVLGDAEGSFGVFSAVSDTVDDINNLGNDDLANKMLDFEYTDVPKNAVLNGNHDGIHVDEQDSDRICFKSSAKKSIKRILEDDDDENNNEESNSVLKKHRINNSEIFLNGMDEDDDSFDENNISLNLIKEGLIVNSPKGYSIQDDHIEAIVKPKEKTEYIAFPPFQPSSTPTHLMHRYMAWNAIGIIRCHSEVELSTIDVEFHNTSICHPLHFPNVNNNTMAALSDTAVAFACERQEDSASKLSCNHFASWDNNKEWSTVMPDKESIEALAVNSSHVVVGTSHRHLRIFTVSGLQLQLFRLPGKVVAIAMHKVQMMILFHRSSGRMASETLGILNLCFNGGTWSVSSESTVSLKEKVSVVWCGYSTEGTPAFVDSRGNILIAQRKHGGWLNIGNTKKQSKNKSDNYWVIGIEERSTQIKCIYCKGADFPATLPVPVPIFIKYQIPLCEPNTEKSIKEHELLKNRLVASNLAYNRKYHLSAVPDDLDSYEIQQAQLLIQLFALACKANRDFRAVEIGRLMSLHSIGLAIQYATKMQRMSIAQRLNEIAQEKALQLQEDNVSKTDSDAELDAEETNSSYALYGGDKELEISDISDKTDGIGKRTQNKVLSVKSRFRLSSEETPPKSENQQSFKTKNIDCNRSDTYDTRSCIKTTQVNNPFKKLNSKVDTSRGTDYFESLSSQNFVNPKLGIKNDNLTANTKKKSANLLDTKKVKAINFQKKTTVDKEAMKEIKPTNIDKPNGFQLFMKKQSSDKNVSEIMNEWKELNRETKEFWNNKAQNNNLS